MCSYTNLPATVMTVIASPVVLAVVLAMLLGLTFNVQAKGDNNSTSVSDPLQRVMLEYHLYQEEVEPLMKQLEDRGQTIHWLKSIFSPRRTLIVIDMQNDFIGGSLPVSGASEIIDRVESLTKLDIWYQVLYTQDWHPTDHISFFSNLGLRQLDPTWLSVTDTRVENIKMFDEVTFKRYPPYSQRLWPDHCVQGTEGAKFHSNLTTPKRSQIIQKGTNPLIDSYSAFYDNTDIKGSGDTGLQRRVKDSTEVVVVGLAQDYCVAFTALDSLELGLPTTILTDHTRPVDVTTGEKMMEKVKEAGGIVSSLQDYREELSEWSKAKEVAHFLIRNSAGSFSSSFLLTVILTVISLTIRQN